MVYKISNHLLHFLLKRLMLRNSVCHELYDKGISILTTAQKLVLATDY